MDGWGDHDHGKSYLYIPTCRRTEEIVVPGRELERGSGGVGGGGGHASQVLNKNLHFLLSILISLVALLCLTG